MGLGMIGAIGGVGVGLSNESKFLERQDEADANTARQKDYQGWLMQQQQQYQIATEQRADVRDEQKKDRDFARTQNEAPVRRDIAVEDEKAKARGKSAVAAETVDTDAGVKQRLTDAGISTDDKQEKKARTRYYDSLGDAATTKADAAGKMEPADTAELQGIRDRAKSLQANIDKAMAEPGAWNPEQNPGQKQLQSQLAAMQLRERAILQKYRADGSAPDPLGMRTPARRAGGAAPAQPEAAQPPAQPGMIGAFSGSPDDATMAVASIKDPQERANAQAALQAQLRAGGGKLPAPGQVPAAPAPGRPPVVAQASAPAAAAPVGPTEALGREVDASRAELKALTGKAPGLKAGAAARQEYAAKVQALRAKVKQQEQRYAEAVGNQGAAFVFR